MEFNTAIFAGLSQIRLRFPLDIDVFKGSLDALIQHHKVLRTAITVIEGQQQQVITSSLTFSLPIVELHRLSEAEQEFEILRLIKEEVQRPFDMSQAPLMRATLLKLRQEDYLFLLNTHFIISDVCSTNLLCLELAAYYEASSHGLPYSFADSPIVYADVTCRQKEQAQENTLADQLAYWKKQLEDAPTILHLPTDHPRLPVQTYHEAIQPFTLSKSLTDDLKALSHREGVSLYTTLMAAFQTLLHRYTGQDDLLVGSSTAGHVQPGIEKLPGSFANILVLRTNLSGNPTFRELLRHVHEIRLDAHTHQALPFAYLVEALQIEHNTVQNPLFQVMLTLAPPSPVLPPGWTFAQTMSGASVSNLDLSLELDDRAEGIIGCFKYNNDLFEVATSIRMLGHWKTLLESIAADPEQRLGEVSFLTKAERHQLLEVWNISDFEYASDKCVHQVFEAQAERTPEEIAVVFEEKTLTYRELNRQANQLAHFLQQQGVGPEVSVAIYIERSLEMVVGLLSILKAGGAYVPLDLTYPAARLSFMLADSQASVLLTQEQLIPKLPEYEGHIVYLDADWEKIAQESEENPVSGVTGDCLAYVIYTSGSTGKPKGVLINHASVVHLFETTRTLFHFDQRDVWSLFHSYAFDFSVWELWSPLLSGGRLVVVPYEINQSSEAFYELLCTQKVTILNQCPGAFHQLIRAEESAGAARSLSLRVVIFGCEALEFQSLKPWFHRQGDLAPQLVVMYGPTETSVFVTSYPLSAEDLELSAGSIIGQPIPGLQIYLLDQYRQQVPIGVPGEIYIGGTGLARGYLHRPELTAERFVSNPFSQKPDARLYKTGDLARYQLDGNIEFLGRVDEQVKIRGFRVEPGEVDAVLAQHPAVAQEVVVVREDTPGDKRLVAYIVAVQGQKLTIKNLRSYLAEKLPLHMVPSAFMLLDTLPLTHNSKIDRRALPVPQWIEHTPDEAHVPPASLVHYQLVQIWEGLLDIHPIGIKDNFFNLGGYSLLATRMVNQFEQVSGKKIPLATLFAGPTIEQLEHSLQQQEEKTSRYPLVAVQANGTRTPFFFLHGDWTRGAFYCFHLATTLGADQPFYALEPYKVDGLHIPATFEEMAAAHLLSLRALQPVGPYFLGGFCNGGLLAYEMGRQLQAQGQKVDLLLLINPSPPSYLRFLRSVTTCIGNLMGYSQDRQADWFLALRHAFRHIYRHLRPSNDARLQDFEQLIQVDSRLNAMCPPVEALRKDYVGIFTWLATGYTLRHYSGKITFFWSSEEAVTRMEWSKVAETTEVETSVVPGTHMSCVTEHIDLLAKGLSVCLSKAQAVMLSKQHA